MWTGRWRRCSETRARHRILQWGALGRDECQFWSPGADLSAGSLTRTPHSEFAVTTHPRMRWRGFDFEVLIDAVDSGGQMP